MQNQRQSIMWREGQVPVSTRFDDPYFSLENGLEETRHVFLAGNELPARFRPGFHIAELGFGTGLNLLAAWEAWQESGQEGPLRYTSFEAYPMQTTEMALALSAFPSLASYAEKLLAAYGGQGGKICPPGLELEIIKGDARLTLPRWEGQADAWFLDGFSPAKNPELWEPALMAEVAKHMTTDGTFATYTAAGAVRRALSEAGFTVERIPGFGRKRHMSRGRLTS